MTAIAVPPAGANGPTRTCVGCRKRDDKVTLLRVVVIGGRLVADFKAIQPGRGAYVHRDRKCLDQARHRNAFARALRVSGELDVDSVIFESEQ